MIRIICICILMPMLAACGGEDVSGTVGSETANATSSPVMELTEAETLSVLLDQYWEEYLKLKPHWATFYGDNRYNDQLPNLYSAPFREQQRSLHERYLERAQEINYDALAGQDRLSYDIFIYDRELALEGLRYPDWLIPIDQYSIYSDLALMGSGASLQPFETVKDYEDWFSRVVRIEVMTNTAIANMREGLAKGYSQPRAVMKKVVGQFDKMVVEDVEQSSFWQSIRNLPEDISEPERVRLTKQYRALLTDTVMPAYVRMRDYLRNDYLPRCRESSGYGALPDGKDWYAYLVKRYTSTNLTPEEIHEIGKQEVARILDEMRQVMDEVGYEGGLRSFFEHLQTDDQFYFESADELIGGYKALQKPTRAALTDYFSIFPKVELEVRPVEAFRAQTAAVASYLPGALDGSRPGVFFINAYDLRSQPKYKMESLYLHEAEPGHHFAMSIQRAIKGLPAFRRFRRETSYGEGWGLYAESIGREIGLFTDPYQYYGKLDLEQLRAMRLVVDTGLHYYGWSRQQAIEYMQVNSSRTDTETESEVERYMSNPGQALAYKIGQKAIRDMRKRAEQMLGDNFDIKAFHREILIDGELPMEILGKKIDRWIAEEKTRLAEAA